MSWHDHDEWVKGYEMLGNRECADFYFYDLCLRGFITASAKEGRLRMMQKRDPAVVYPQSAQPPEAFDRDVTRGTCPHSVLFVCKAEIDDLRKYGTQYTAATTVQRAITEA